MTAVDQLFAKALEIEPEDRRELGKRLARPAVMTLLRLGAATRKFSA